MFKKIMYSFMILCFTFGALFSGSMSVFANNDMDINSSIHIDIATGEQRIPILGTVPISEAGYFGRRTGPTVTYTEFSWHFTGTTLNGWAARNLSPTVNLEAAARRSAINVWGSIRDRDEYFGRWTNRVSCTATSCQGSIINVRSTSRTVR